MKYLIWCLAMLAVVALVIMIWWTATGRMQW